MIYNARKKGPMEYDKFMLMLVDSMVRASEEASISLNNEDLGGFKDIVHRIDIAFNEFTKEWGTTDILLKDKMNRGGFNGNT